MEKMIKPMLCSVGEKDILNRTDYYFECKFDGVRAIAIKGKLYGRKGNDISFRYPEIIKELPKDLECDGEIVCGTSFNDIQQREHQQNPFKIATLSKLLPAKYIIFHIFNGKLKETQHIIKAHQYQNGYWLWLEIRDNPLYDGVIAKKKDYTYKFSGTRSKEWLKIKFNNEAEIEAVKYTINPSGIRVESKEGIAVQIAGIQHIEIKKLLDKKGKAKILINYLEKTKEGRYRQPTFNRLIET